MTASKPRTWPFVLAWLGMFVVGLMLSIGPVAFYAPNKPPWWWAITATLGFVMLIAAIFGPVLLWANAGFPDLDSSRQRAQSEAAER